jgi:DNA-binding transcriptional MerR regulator
MIKYSIADLENITGIKAHTIRIWEKRYQLITPFRTTTNIRYYDNDQMKKLVNVASLIRSGMKISKVSQLTSDQLNDEVNKRLGETAGTESSVYETYTGKLITAGLEFDETTFNQVFSNALVRYGLQVCYEKILLPLMNRVGMFWCTNHMNPAQEHFVSNLVKQKLHTAIDALPPATSTQKPCLLYLPHNEDHEIGLLMANISSGMQAGM